MKPDVSGNGQDLADQSAAIQQPPINQFMLPPVNIRHVRTTRVYTNDQGATAVEKGRPASSALSSTMPDTCSVFNTDTTAAVDEKAVMKKLQWRIVPWMMLVVILCYFDRTNLAFAAAPLNSDLGFDHTVYGLGSGLFFIGYAIFQVPSNMVLVAVGPHRWLPLITTLWGAVACCFVVMRNVTQFYVLRFLLGVAESGAFPGIYYYLTMFFPKQHLPVPYAAVEASILISHALSAPLAAGILATADRVHVRGWKLLFATEGLATVVLGCVLWLVLPRDVREVHRLLPRERAWLLPQLHGKDTEASEHAGQVRWADLKVTLKDGCVWYIGVLKMLKDVANYGIFFFTPMIVKAIMDGSANDTDDTSPEAQSSGKSYIIAVLITAVPYTIAALASIAIGWSSQRSGERPLHIAAPYAVAGVALGLFPVALKAPVSGLVVLTIAVSGIYGANAVTVSLLATLLAGQPMTRATSFALYNAVGNLGGFIGPYIVGRMVERTASYGWAMLLLSGFIFASALMALWVRTWRRLRGPSPEELDSEYSRLHNFRDGEEMDGESTPLTTHPLKRVLAR